MAQIEIHQVSTPLAGPTAIADTFLVRAPSAANGGGLTIREVIVKNGAATTAGTCFAVVVEKRSAAGTPVTQGTITTIGGTGDVFADAAPKSGTLSGTAVFLNAGESLWAKVVQTASGTPTACQVQVLYQMGR